jgi:glycine/D-amino acid oxidase-like deaminating enzyme
MGLDQLIPEEKIRARSYAIWLAEGCKDGRSEEYWFRAVAELESELMRAWLVALEERENTELVMPRLPISQPVYRHQAGRIDPDALREAA